MGHQQPPRLAQEETEGEPSIEESWASDVQNEGPLRGPGMGQKMSDPSWKVKAAKGCGSSWASGKG